MKLKVILELIAGIILVWVVTFYWQNLRGIGPVIKPPPENIAETINTTGMPLKLPSGFSIEIFAKNLPGARVMKFDQFGNMWVSQTSQGAVSLLEVRDGKVQNQTQIIKGLHRPHGLLFGTGEQFAKLYIAEEDKIIAIPTYSDGELEKVVDLPSGGNHYTRTIVWLPGSENTKMLVSIGSTCNVCREEDQRRGAVSLFDLGTKELKVFARGLRNSVFMAIHPVTGEIWATEMGRDLLGDDIPPDEINIIDADKNFGWPNCYGKNIHDTEFDKNIYIRNPCLKPFETPSHIDIQAHSAPLGLAFIPEDPPSLKASGEQRGWPKGMWHDLLVAYHGSWNRSVPTGYKIVRYDLDEKGNVLGVSDFITGWLKDGESLGRPVDILIQPGGVMYISDDKAGVIYRVSVNHKSEPIKYKDLLILETPTQENYITSPLLLRGKARGNWFFEASFPIILLDANGKEIATSIARAAGNWMTAEYVPFETTLAFKPPGTDTGTLILKKDNPSGLPEKDDYLSIQVRFR